MKKGNAYNEQLDGRQQQALAMLLLKPSIRQAARAAEVDDKTLRQWLKEPAFRDAYREARAAAVDNATALLQQTTQEAARTLRKNLKASEASDQIRAAKILLEMAFKAGEVEALAIEVAELKKQLAEMKAHVDSKSEAGNGQAENPGAGSPPDPDPPGPRLDPPGPVQPVPIGGSRGAGPVAEGVPLF